MGDVDVFLTSSLIEGVGFRLRLWLLGGGWMMRWGYVRNVLQRDEREKERSWGERLGRAIDDILQKAGKHSSNFSRLFVQARVFLRVNSRKIG